MVLDCSLYVEVGHLLCDQINVLKKHLFLFKSPCFLKFSEYINPTLLVIFWLLKISLTPLLLKWTRNCMEIDCHISYQLYFNVKLCYSFKNKKHFSSLVISTLRKNEKNGLHFIFWKGRKRKNVTLIIFDDL